MQASPGTFVYACLRLVGFKIKEALTSLHEAARFTFAGATGCLKVDQVMVAIRVELIHTHDI